jgi:hypothetical protein
LLDQLIDIFRKFRFLFSLEIKNCLDIWNDYCRDLITTKNVTNMFRQHFLRSYYNNRAPNVFYLNADWLKRASTETVVYRKFNLGLGFRNNYTTIHMKYNHLDGLLNFINTTTTENKNVYFVTARQAVEWIKMLPTLIDERADLERFIRDHLFKDVNQTRAIDLNGECHFKGDYDVTKGLFLDDDQGVELSTGLNPQNVLSSKTILQFKSELLFVNDFVLYFMISLSALAFLIITQESLTRFMN